MHWSKLPACQIKHVKVSRDGPTWQADGQLVVAPKRGIAYEFASVGMSRAARDGSSTGGEPAAAQDPVLLHHEGGLTLKRARLRGCVGNSAVTTHTFSSALHTYSTAASTTADRALWGYTHALSLLLTAAPPSRSTAAVCERERERKRAAAHILERHLPPEEKNKKLWAATSLNTCNSCCCYFFQFYSDLIAWCLWWIWQKKKSVWLIIHQKRKKKHLFLFHLFIFKIWYVYIYIYIYI